MKIKLLALAALLGFGVPFAALADGTTVSLDYGGAKRTYILHVPPNVEPGKRYPLIIALHGMNGTAEGFEGMTGFDTAADQYGFFVAYPDSDGPKWDLRGRDGDIGFAEKLLADVVQNNPVDAARIYVAGHSQGAGLAQALACFDTDKVAGVAVVSENMHPHFEQLCRPSRPIPVLLFHGTADPISPYNGGANGVSGTDTLSSEATAQFWAQADGCSGNSVTTSFPDKISDGTTTTSNLQTWGRCRNGATVAFYTIAGGGHTWPGAAVKRDRFGGSSTTVHASEIILHVFSETLAAENSSTQK